jgi:hypothetical protein
MGIETVVVWCCLRECDGAMSGGTKGPVGDEVVRNPCLVNLVGWGGFKFGLRN